MEKKWKTLIFGILPGFAVILVGIAHGLNWAKVSPEMIQAATLIALGYAMVVFGISEL